MNRILTTTCAVALATGMGSASARAQGSPVQVDGFAQLGYGGNITSGSTELYGLTYLTLHIPLSGGADTRGSVPDWGLDMTVFGYGSSGAAGAYLLPEAYMSFGNVRLSAGLPQAATARYGIHSPLYRFGIVATDLLVFRDGLSATEQLASGSFAPGARLDFATGDVAGSASLHYGLASNTTQLSLAGAYSMSNWTLSGGVDAYSMGGVTSLGGFVGFEGTAGAFGYGIEYRKGSGGEIVHAYGSYDVNDRLKVTALGTGSGTTRYLGAEAEYHTGSGLYASGGVLLRASGGAATLIDLKVGMEF